MSELMDQSFTNNWKSTIPDQVNLIILLKSNIFYIIYINFMIDILISKLVLIDMKIYRFQIY